MDLYQHVPKREFYTQLAQVLDLSFVRELTAPLYAARMGRPSLDPVVFFKCMLVAFFENIVYDTELEFRLADSLVIRRFLGYGLDEATPDESTLRKTRQRMPEEVFRTVFTQVLHVCAADGLIRGRALGTDSTYVDANASLDSLVHKELGCTYEAFMLALRRQDAPDLSRETAQTRDRRAHLPLDNASWTSTTDVDARVMQHADGHTHLSYAVDATVDVETGCLVQVSAEPADVGDRGTVLDRVTAAQEALAPLELTPQVVVADKGHHGGEILRDLEAQGVVPLVSSPATPTGPAGFRREDFTYEAATDRWLCPVGHALTRRPDRANGRVYKTASGARCRACPHFGVCTTAYKGRSLLINHDDDVIQANRTRVRTAAGWALLLARKTRGEAPFGYFKQFGGLRRLSGRGLDHAQKKVLIAGTGWNLLLLVKRRIAAAYWRLETRGRFMTALMSAVMGLCSAIGASHAVQAIRGLNGQRSRGMVLRVA